MGFIDWIQEPAIEGYGQFYDGKHTSISAPPPKVTCSICQKEFSTSEKLLSHSRQTHPLSLPILSICGNLIPSEFTIRTPLTPSAIQFENVQQIQIAINGVPKKMISFDEFQQSISEIRDGFVDVWLTNLRALDDAHSSSSHRLYFRIPEQGDILAIESAFIETMKQFPIAVSSITPFWEACKKNRTTAASSDFANALSQYIIGMAIKQGEKMKATPFDRFKEKFGSALEVLSHYTTPLSLSISDIIRFNLNDFTSGIAGTLPDLALTTSFLRSPDSKLDTSFNTRRPALKEPAKCPVDDMTEKIIHAAVFLLENKLKKLTIQAKLTTLFDHSPLSEYDRLKLHILIASMYIKYENLQAALPHLRALRSEPNLITWAEKHINDQS